MKQFKFNINKATLIAIILIAVLVCNSVTVTKAQIIFDGKCGSTSQFELDENGLLHIYGTGEVYDKKWSEYENDVKEVVIDEGITSIKGYYFLFCSNLKDISVPKSLVYVGLNPLMSTLYERQSKNYDYAVLYCGHIALTTEDKDLYGGNNLYFRKGTSVIAEECFKKTHLNVINLPDCVEYLNSKCFSYISELESITIGRGVKYVSPDVLEGSRNVKEVTIKSDYLTEEDIGYIAQYAEVIYGFANSAAKAYAEKNGKNFIKIDRNVEDFKVIEPTEYVEPTTTAVEVEPTENVEPTTEAVEVEPTESTSESTQNTTTTYKEVTTKNENSSSTVSKPTKNDEQTTEFVTNVSSNHLTKKDGKTAVTLSKTSKGIDVKWKRVNKCRVYKVYRSTKKKSGYKCLKKTKAIHYVDKKIEPEKTYYYYVKSFSDGIWWKSNTKKIKNKVSIKTPKIKVTQDRVSWSIVWGILDSNCSGIMVYVENDKGKYILINDTQNIKTKKNSKGIQGLRSSINSLTPGKVYKFKVRTYISINKKKIYSKWSKVKTLKRK